MATDFDGQFLFAPSDRQYEIGYGRPPLFSRFQPGQSGNPTGRRRGSKGHSTIIRRVAFRRVFISGKLIHKRNIDLVLEVVRRAAAKGDYMALALVKRYTGYVEDDEFPIAKGVLILGEELTEGEWIAKYGRLGTPNAGALEESCFKSPASRQPLS